MARDEESYGPDDANRHLRRAPRSFDEDAHGLGNVARRHAETNYGDRFGAGPRVRGFRGQNPPSDLGTARALEPYDRGYRRKPGGPYGERYGDEDPRFLGRDRDDDEDSGSTARPNGRGRARGHRGRGPKNYQRSDERIREDVSERLWDADDVDASDVTVEVQDGVVQLRGTVEQRRTRHQIEDIADECAGVKDIRNDIRVQRPSDWPYRKQVAPGSTGGSSGKSGSAASSEGMVQASIEEMSPHN